MINHSFNFKLVDVVPYVKGDKRMAKVVAYCCFGFTVNFYVTEDIANKLKLKSKDTNFNFTDYINVFYDNDKQRFVYVINSKNI